jgi:hypothetical protein
MLILEAFTSNKLQFTGKSGNDFATEAVVLLRSFCAHTAE